MRRTYLSPDMKEFLERQERVGPRRVKVNDEIRQQVAFIKGQAQQTGMPKFLKFVSAPADLTPQTISNIHTGRYKRVLNSHAYFIETLYKSLNES